MSRSSILLLVISTILYGAIVKGSESEKSISERLEEASKDRKGGRPIIADGAFIIPSNVANMGNGPIMPGFQMPNSKSSQTPSGTNTLLPRSPFHMPIGSNFYSNQGKRLISQANVIGSVNPLNLPIDKVYPRLVQQQQRNHEIEGKDGVYLRQLTPAQMAFLPQNPFEFSNAVGLEVEHINDQFGGKLQFNEPDRRFDISGLWTSRGKKFKGELDVPIRTNVTGLESDHGESVWKLRGNYIGVPEATVVNYGQVLSPMNPFDVPVGEAMTALFEPGSQRNEHVLPVPSPPLKPQSDNPFMNG